MTNRTKEDFLPEELVWAAGGHASDVVLTAMADGQVGIVPPLVLAHVEKCTACTTHLGNAALLSLHTGREMALLPPSRSAELVAAETAARQPLPRLAIVLGLAFAALGLVPTLLDAPSEPSGARSFATKLPMFVNGLGTLGRRLLEPGSPVGLALTYGATALLVLMAFALLRLVPKKEVSR
jgi:hypothetical protein